MGHAPLTLRTGVLLGLTACLGCGESPSSPASGTETRPVSSVPTLTQSVALSASAEPSAARDPLTPKATGCEAWPKRPPGPSPWLTNAYALIDHWPTIDPAKPKWLRLKLTSSPVSGEQITFYLERGARPVEPVIFATVFPLYAPGVMNFYDHLDNFEGAGVTTWVLEGYFSGTMLTGSEVSVAQYGYLKQWWETVYGLDAPALPVFCTVAWCFAPDPSHRADIMPESRVESARIHQKRVAKLIQAGARLCSPKDLASMPKPVE